MKFCKICLLYCDDTEFYKNRKSTLNYCKSCCAKRYKRYRRDWELQHDFGVSIEFFEGLQQKQESKCAICGIYSSKLHLDHNHSTQKVRELLCFNCNVALGYFKESPDIIKAALFYLEKHNV